MAEPAGEFKIYPTRRFGDYRQDIAIKELMCRVQILTDQVAQLERRMNECGCECGCGRVGRDG